MHSKTTPLANDIRRLTATTGAAIVRALDAMESRLTEGRIVLGAALFLLADSPVIYQHIKTSPYFFG